MRIFKFITILNVFVFFSSIVFSQTAKEIIKKADDKFRGKSAYNEMTMTIVRPKWSRTVSFKSCNKGLDYSMTLVTNPAKEKGQTFMKRKNEMWSWNPKIRRLIKLPASMMSQGWMGSDFSNDDLLKESSLVVDYTHKIINTETYADKVCYKIELIPKEDAAVVWGKLVKWITKDNYLQLKTEFYDEDDYLIKTEKASKVKIMSGREIPTYFELIPEDEPGNKTIVIMDKIIYDINVSESFFSQQNMKKGMTLRFPVK
ncbi:MAG: outer membrane lipoprotein-sorting protein [Bacteroidales bacterium]|nr:outer membrane lipoprotein-sorting protein [Bacteroidales bacterium]